MVFGGGMPRANFSDRHTVSVVHGSSHVTFDFSSRVIDFTLLCQPTSSDGVWSVLNLNFRVLSYNSYCSIGSVSVSIGIADVT